MIKKLDIFIIKKFLGTFFLMIGVFVIIAVIFDVSENIDELVNSNATVWQIITHYYFNFCLFFGTMLSSLIIFLTIIWFTSKMAQRSEVIAMLSGGMSYARFLRPFFIASSFLVLLSLLLSHFIVPMANKVKYDFEVQYLKGALTVSDLNIHREIEPGVIAYCYKVNPGSYSCSNFSLEKWKDNRLTWKLISSGATFDTLTGRWMLNNIQTREFLPDGKERLITKQRLDTVMDVSIDDFGLRSEIVGSMNWNELNDFIEDQRLSGSGNVFKYELEKYNRTASPFSIFILTLIGVSIASRKSRGGTGLHLMLAVVIGFIFIFISRVTAVSAMNLGFPTYLSVWVANVVFLFLGLFLYSKAQT
ncbi:MAG: LptF/LptG family permease [Crocinitomicaceae bacterium]|nr:LptF/LptG family permease [Crocinitomicaceae bacterium]